MQHWPWRDRFLDSPPEGWKPRCLLRVEELEPREVLSLLVIPPSPSMPLEIDENQSVALAFEVLGPDIPDAPYTLTITGSNGLLQIAETLAAANNVSVDGNNSSTVTLVGRISELNTVLADGLTFNPTPFYSGDAAVTLTAVTIPPNNPSNILSASEVQAIAVQPVVSSATVVVSASDQVFAPASGFVFPPGFVTISGWNDADGSETITLDIIVTPTSSSSSSEFTLSADGTILTPVATNRWRLTGSNPTAFQALLDTLVLTPASSQPFSGTVFVDFEGTLVDQAVFGPTGNRPTPLEVTTEPQDLGFATAMVRFFVGGSVTVAPLSAQEGTAADLGGGRIVASSPDEQPGDLHVLSLTVPSGLLLVNSSAVPTGLTVDRQVAGDGRTTLRLIGTIATINQFLAVSNSVTYTAAASTFSGLIPLTVGLVNLPGVSSSFSPPANFFPPSNWLPPGPPPGTTLTNGGGFLLLDPSAGGFFTLNMPPSVPNSFDTLPRREALHPFSIVVAMQFTPVATPVVPSAADVVTTQDTPVGVVIHLVPPSTDPTETVEIIVEGVPAGASFNRGTHLGGGKWLLAPADLEGLIFIPPPGVTGEFPLVVTVIVTDTNLSLEMSDIATHATTFTITVLPVPPASSPPLFLPPDLARPLSGGGVVAGGGNRPEPLRGLIAGSTADLPTPQSEVFLGYTGSSGNSSLPFGQWPRVELSVPSPEYFFAPVEPVVPIYATSEKHPLPPVLPLDQTLPVAGFTDSGGDSFALVDMVYRDAGVSGPVSVAPAPHEPDRPAAVATAEPVVFSPVANTRSDPPAASMAAVAAPEETPRAWLVGVGTAMIAGSVAAWGWLRGRSGGLVGRTLRRLVSALLQPSVKRTS